MTLDWPDLRARLARSSFRSKFRLDARDADYLHEKGIETILRHAADFIAQRLAPAHPRNDGRQTPWKGHPVFVAQHATGCCCRSCLRKWHNIPEGRPLTSDEQEYVLTVLAYWLKDHMPFR